MRRSFLLFLAFALTVAFVIGCSGGGGGEVTLPPVQKSATNTSSIGTHLWGTYQVVIDKNTHKVDIVRLRGAESIINVVGFLEPPPLGNMTIDFDTLIIDDVSEYIGVDVILKHPIPDPVFMGFDVRGVCIGPDVTNADGVTPVMNPADFDGEAFGYIDGLLGAPNSFGNYDGVWGYKYFCDGLGLNDNLATFFSDELNLADRGVFRDGSTNTRHYDISWTNSPHDFFVFNYAIYANYDWPLGELPIELDDFPPTANSAEAFCISVNEVANGLWYNDGMGSGGGTISLDVEVFDWQGLSSTIVTVDDILPDSTAAGSTSKSMIYNFVDMAPVVMSSGTLEMTVKAESETTYGEAWFLDLLNPANPLYGEPVWNGMIHSAMVSDCPAPTCLSITPTSGQGTVDDAVITGSGILDGPNIGALLRMAGQTDIDATDVVFDDVGQTITCDFNLAGAEPGDWEVHIVNGCGTESNETDVLFTVIGGFGIVACDDLPTPLPVPDQKDMCVVGDDSQGNDGVYYMNANYQVYYYPLDYSGVGQLYMTLAGNYGYSIQQLCGPVSGFGSIELDATGGLCLNTNNTGYTWTPPYLQNGPIFWWQANNPALANALLLSSSWGTVINSDCEAEMSAFGVLWCYWNLVSKIQSSVQLVQTGLGYPYTSGAYSSFWNVDWAPIDQSGSVDCQVSDLEAYRLAVDSDPIGLSGGDNIIFYYMESDPDEDGIEIFSNNKYSQGSSDDCLGTIDADLDGDPVDVCVLPTEECIPDDATTNWLFVLIDNEDGTWSVQIFDQDGVEQGSAGPYDGDVLCMDGDVQNCEVHVWYDDGGTLRYCILGFS